MKITVRTSSSATAQLSGATRAAVSVGTQGPPGVSITQIASMSDVDMSLLEDGCVLVYNASSNKWIAQRILNKQVIDMGSESY